MQPLSSDAKFMYTCLFGSFIDRERSEIQFNLVRGPFLSHPQGALRELSRSVDLDELNVYAQVPMKERADECLVTVSVVPKPSFT